MYRLVYRPEIPSDLNKLDKSFLPRVKARIEALETDPSKIGKPLGGKLTGNWKIRIDTVRIVYRCVGRKIVILGVGNRDAIYETIFGRIRGVNLHT